MSRTAAEPTYRAVPLYKECTDQPFLLSEVTPFLLLVLPLGRSAEEQNPGAGTGTHDGVVTGVWAES